MTALIHRTVNACRLILPLILAASWLYAAEPAKALTGTPSDFNVRSFGAVGDGKTKDTRAIQKAIDKCASLGGGMVYLPAGAYLCGPVFLKSNVTLNLDSGARLLGSRDWDDYPIVRGRWEGIETEHRAALVTGIDLENVSIIGHGVIDGQGDAWWGEYKRLNKLAKSLEAAGVTVPKPGQEKEFKEAQRAKYPRPRLINLINCKNVTIRDLTLQNSPSWTLHPVYCENVVIDGLTVLAPGNSPNTDGINPDSCRLVRISNCNISVGDDCITLKSGKDADGRRVNKPCEDITITNCIMRAGHGGVVIGSEMSGGVRDVTVSNCVFAGTQRGIRIKTQRGRGGVVENISYNNIVMRGMLKEAINITGFYNGGAESAKPEPVTDATPILRNISISNVRVEGAQGAFLCEGLPEMPVSGLSLSNIRISADKGLNWLRVKNVDVRSILVDCKEGTPFTCRDSEGLDISGFKTVAFTAGVPVISFQQVRDAWIHDCLAVPGTGTFLRVEGDKSRDIRMSGNNLSSAVTPVVTISAPADAVIVER